jgi:hypothetical protein
VAAFLIFFFRASSERVYYELITQRSETMVKKTNAVLLENNTISAKRKLIGHTDPGLLVVGNGAVCPRNLRVVYTVCTCCGKKTRMLVRETPG